jgi:hypothetical protein
MALHSPNDYNLRVELSQNFSLSLIVVEVDAPDYNTALIGIRRVFSEELLERRICCRENRSCPNYAVKKFSLKVEFY